MGASQPHGLQGLLPFLSTIGHSSGVQRLSAYTKSGFDNSVFLLSYIFQNPNIDRVSRGQSPKINDSRLEGSATVDPISERRPQCQFHSVPAEPASWMFRSLRGHPPMRSSISMNSTLLYRSLCTMLYNYVPMSGHPGGSISSGRMVAGLLFHSLDYDISEPDREDADIISYSAGHKALGLYAMWALRNEILRLGAPELLPTDEGKQLRLEDLLGFRKNPTNQSPLTRKLRTTPLDGHPTPATPFVRLATGASGVGVASSIGLALGRPGHLRTPGTPRSHHRGRRRAHPRTGGRGPRRSGYRFPGQCDPAS